MRVLYGVVGEGMGHATRSLVLLEHLLGAGHEVRVVVSGRAHALLRERLRAFPRATVEEIAGLTLQFEEGGGLDLLESLRENLERAPKRLLHNVGVYRRVAEAGFAPDVVISDFESWAYVYARVHRKPVISIDNMQVLNRCRHDPAVLGPERRDFLIARLAVKAKLPGAYHYLVTSFFFPPVRKARTTLVPPILRPPILAAVREPRDHVLVYPSAAMRPDLLDVLRRLPGRFVVYGFSGAGSGGTVTVRPFAEEGFVDDFRTARAVIAGGGFSFMSEAVHLRVPMLVQPIEGQFEQELNARWLAHLGYGTWTRTLDADTVATFLERTDGYATALRGYCPQDNTTTFACLDELLARVARGEPRPDRLVTPAMGSWPGDDAAG